MEETQIKSYLHKLLFPRYQYENNPFLKINSPHTSKVEYIKCCKEGKKTVAVGMVSEISECVEETQSC